MSAKRDDVWVIVNITGEVSYSNARIDSQRHMFYKGSNGIGAVAERNFMSVAWLIEAGR
jgi:hypothetical protein